MFRALCILLLASLTIAFITRPAMIKSTRITKALKMSSSEEDPLEELKRRMQQDPNFNPATDPRMAEALEAAVPSELRDIPLAVERLIVAFRDATTGVDAVENLDESAKMFTDEKFISTPQSKWFKEGAPKEEYSSSTKSSLRDKLTRNHPEVKLE